MTAVTVTVTVTAADTVTGTRASFCPPDQQFTTVTDRLARKHVTGCARDAAAAVTVTDSFTGTCICPVTASTDCHSVKTSFTGKSGTPPSPVIAASLEAAVCCVSAAAESLSSAA